MQKLLEHLRYEILTNLLNQALAILLGLVLGGTIVLTIGISIKIQHLKKSIIQLQYEKDSINNEIRRFPMRIHCNSVFLIEKNINFKECD